MLGYSNIILFLVGATLTSGHVLRNRISTGSWNPAANLVFIYLPSPSIEPSKFIAGSPLSSGLWPMNTNLFYKPRMMMAPDDIPITNEIYEKDCDVFKESIPFFADKNRIETNEFKPIPEKTEQPLVPIMLEELLKPSPIMEIIEHKEPLIIPQAPELPALHMPEIPVLTPGVATSPALEEPLTPHTSEFQPIEIPKAPELPSFAMPEIPQLIEKNPCRNPEYPALSSQPEDVEIFSEFRPHNIPSAPEFPPLYLPEPSFISSISPMEPTESKEPEINLEFKPNQIPAAPELPPIYLPESPVSTRIEVIPCCSPDKVYPSSKLIPEYRSVNILPPPELPPLSMPEASYEITSNIIDHSHAREFTPLRVNIPSAPELPSLNIPKFSASNELNSGKFENTPAQEFTQINIPAAPELPSLSFPESLSPIETTHEDVRSQEYPLRVNIPAAPELPPLTISELSSPIEILEKTPAPEHRPSDIPQFPTFATDSVFVEPYILESPQEDRKPLVIPQAPELPPLKISELHPVLGDKEIPTAPHPEEIPVQVPDVNHILPNPAELPPFLTHKMEPIVVEAHASGNDEEPCKKDDTIPPVLISQPLPSPMMYPVFLAQNIIIERVVPQLYLSHTPNNDANRSHPVIPYTSFESEMY